MDYTTGIGAEIDALCELFARLADKNAFHPDTPDLYKRTGMQVLVQGAEPNEDTHIILIVFGTPDNHLCQVKFDMKKMSKGYLAQLVHRVLLDLDDARDERRGARPEIIMPPSAETQLSASVSKVLH